ncbi:MAG: DUF423 domain-containing protein [Verrucomicrobiota bacterium]
MLWVRIGALFCFLAVGLGAFGAHALKNMLAAHQSREVWQTAVLYHFLHALALILLGFHQANRLSCYLFAAGIILFSGSLYGLALTNARWLGPITPLGGLCFLAGWVCLFLAPKG